MGGVEEGWFLLLDAAKSPPSSQRGGRGICLHYFGASAAGNFEGRTVLHLPAPPDWLADELSSSPALWLKKIETAGRAAPARDARPRRCATEKNSRRLERSDDLPLLAAPGALPIRRWPRRAEAAAEFVLGKMRRGAPGARLWAARSLDSRRLRVRHRRLIAS